MPRESAIDRAIAALCRRRGAYHLKIHGSGVGRNGVADHFIVYHGRAILAEAKQPGRRPTKLQAYELERAAAAGAIAIVAHSAADVEAAMDEIVAQLFAEVA